MQHVSLGLVFGVLVGLASVSVGLRAEEAPVIVVAVQVKGTVEVQHGAASATEPVKDGAQLAEADVVTTAEKSSVVLVLPNGSTVSLREKTRLKIAVALGSPVDGNAVAAKDSESGEPGVSKTNFELVFGEMLTRVRKLNPASTFEVQTPVSVAAVRGTVFEVSYLPGEANVSQYRLSTARGLVHVTPHGGELVKVAADEQVDFSARHAKRGVRVMRVKASKLGPKRQAQLEKEALDTDRSAREMASRAQADASAKAKSAARGEDKTKEGGTAPKDSAKDTPITPKEAVKESPKVAAPPAVKKKTPRPDPVPKK